MDRLKLLMERKELQVCMVSLMATFMGETDKVKAKETLVAIKDAAKRIEEINCKLASDELRKIFRRG